MIAQKAKELTANPSAKELIAETYESLQDEKIEQISALEQKLSSLETDFPSPVPSSAPALFRELLEQKSLTRADIEVLVESIWVDQDGNADIFLRYGLPDRDCDRSGLRDPGIQNKCTGKRNGRSRPGHGAFHAGSVG